MRETKSQRTITNGTANNESDIDIMIISDKYNENDDLIIGKVWKLTKHINTKIEPFLIGLNKFNNDKNSPLIDMVKKNGIEII